MASPLRADAELGHSLRQLSLNGTGPPSSTSMPLTPTHSAAAATAAAASAHRPSRPSRSPAARPSPPSRSPSVAREPARAPGLLHKASTTSLRSVSAMSPSTAATAAAAAAHATPSRRSSMQTSSASPSPLAQLSSTSPEQPLPHRPSPPTAAAIASDYFAAELDALHGEEENTGAETIVILHDDCYGHRFARPRTSRASLGTIVERPERLQASVLGVAVAYVRLGERHAAGRHAIRASANTSAASAAASMPFRIRKTARRVRLTSPTVTNVHGTEWMDELRAMCDSAEPRLAMGETELARPPRPGPSGDGEEERKEAHEAAPLHEGDLYLCAESLAALEGSLGAVCEAVDAVFATTTTTTTPRRAFVAVRPPGHHCSASHPAGFCWVNNVHVGIMHAALAHGLTHAAIIDFDLHHGDGSQAIAWAHNARAQSLGRNAAAWRRTGIGYFSLHDINSYPCESGDDEKVRAASLCIDRAHGQSVWNVHMEEWATEADFWHLYESRYAILLDKARRFLRARTEALAGAAGQPARAAIFLSAGFDASEWESSGMQRHRVNVPTGFYARIGRDVVALAAEEGLAVDGRVISVLEGGYSDRALVSGVCSHVCGLAAGMAKGGDQTAVETAAATNGDGLGVEMGHRIGAIPDLENEYDDHLNLPRVVRDYDPAWWSSAELDRLEAPGPPPPPPPPPQGRRRASPPSYCSPTHSSTARALDPVQYRRSLSGMSNGRHSSLGSRAGSPLPPPLPDPEVSWVVAARELCKLLVPTDRPVGSHRPEELNAEASRARRDRQTERNHAAASADPVPSPASTVTRTSTREKRTVKPYGSEDAATPMTTTTKGRGKAGGGSSAALQAEKAAARGIIPPEPTTATQKRGGRRLSSASTAASVAPSDMGSAAAGTGTVIHSHLAADFRPDSAASMRPESSISVRHPVAGSTASLNIKKTRNSTAAGAGARKPGRPSKKAQIQASAAPSTTSSAGATATGDSPVSASTSATSIAPIADEMDSLAAEVRKVKITIISKAQREAREKEAKEQAERAEQAEREATERYEAESLFKKAQKEAEGEQHEGEKYAPGSFPFPQLPSSPQRANSAASAVGVATRAAATPPPPVIVGGGGLPSFFAAATGGAGPAVPPDMLYHPAGRRISISSATGGIPVAAPKWASSTPSPPVATTPPLDGSPMATRPPNFTPTSRIPFMLRSGGPSAGSGGGSGGSSLVRDAAARIAAREAAALGQAVWGSPEESPEESSTTTTTTLGKRLG